ATGGVKALKTWLFDVEVEGTNARILVEDGQEGKILIEDEDGSTREITVAANQLEDGARANVTVRTSADGMESENVYDVIRRSGPPEGADIPLSKIADAEILGMWSDDAGRAVDLYAAPIGENAEKMQLYVVTEGLGDNTARRVVAAPVASVMFRDAKPNITVDELGTIAIQFDTGDEVAMFKFVTSADGAANAAQDHHGPVHLDPETGSVRVRVTQPE
ncbi:MAG: hypothetical protein AB7N71_10465, partial [Phycisphaerae bacterium]